MYPDADVPVVQLGLDAELPAREHHELARRRCPRRDEGAPITGFGNAAHNLRRMDWNDAAVRTIHAPIPCHAACSGSTASTQLRKRRAG